MWLILALLSAIFASLVAIFGKIGLKNIDSTLATTVRALVMTSFLVLTSLLTGKFSQLANLNGRAFKFIVLSGLAGAISWLFYFAALRLGLASRVATVDRLSVIFVIILAALFLGESLTLRSVTGGLLVVLGTIILIS